MAETLILPPTIGFAFGSQMTSRARVLRAQFGHGYTQRQGDGKNPIERKYSVQFTNLLWEEANTLEDFFIARGGWEAFYYTKPGDDDPTLWICSNWTRTHTDAMTDGMSCDWEEVFIP